MLLILRLIGMLAAGIAGWQLGIALAGFPGGPAPSDAMRYVLVLALAAAALGLLLAPYATIVPLRSLWRLARSIAAADLVGATGGLLVGLLIAALASFPLSLLPSPFGRWLPAAMAVLFGWLGAALGAQRKDEIAGLLHGLWSTTAVGRLGSAALLDTSSIIDGRVVEICLSGFLSGTLAVPRFVLEELQQLSDSADAARRQRGRRGLSMLERLQREFALEIVDTDFPDLRGVDSKLIRLARQRHAAIVTTDYNLNRIAGLQGVPVLNINDLANALRAVVAPGDEVQVEIVQEGRERGQGVAYLEDGTMVVVEGARHLIGSHAEVEVVRVLPTAGGRLVFARLKPGEAASTSVPEPAHRATRLAPVEGPAVPAREEGPAAGAAAGEGPRRRGVGRAALHVVRDGAGSGEAGPTTLG